jgi:hypothetical protein
MRLTPNESKFYDGLNFLVDISKNLADFSHTYTVNLYYLREP